MGAGAADMVSSLSLVSLKLKNRIYELILVLVVVQIQVQFYFEPPELQEQISDCVLFV